MSDEYLGRVRAWLRSADPTPLAEWQSDHVDWDQENQLDLDLPWPRPSVENLRG